MRRNAMPFDRTLNTALAEFAENFCTWSELDQWTEGSTGRGDMVMERAARSLLAKISNADPGLASRFSRCYPGSCGITYLGDFISAMMFERKKDGAGMTRLRSLVGSGTPSVPVRTPTLASMFS